MAKLKEEFKEPEPKKQKIETSDSDSPIDDHVKIEKDKAEETKEEEEDYDSDNDYTNCFKNDGDTKRVQILAIESLKWYNKQMGVKYKLKRVLSAVGFLCAGYSFVIKFLAEEGSSDDEPPLELLESTKELSDKVSYNCGDNKVSDRFFRASVYWNVPAFYIRVRGCAIITEQEANEIG